MTADSGTDRGADRGELPTVDTPLDLEGRRALGNVLERLMGRRAAVRVGRYELGRRLGAGACGAVYEARDPKLDRKVAVKVVLPSRVGQGDDQAEARLLREAQALARLRHPGIVEIFDVGTDELGADARGRPRRGVYIVMELVEGPTLRTWLDTERRSEAEILDVFGHAAVALAAAHRVGVVHRDFKPGNVMLTGDGRPKVLDFGLAREDLEPLGETSPSGRWASVSASDTLTRTGTVLGTPRYMSPEQHDAQPASAASDQYALAVAVWEALTGSPPFQGETIARLAEAKRGGPPPRPPELSRRRHRALARALAPDAARRFPDLPAFATALRDGRPWWRRTSVVGGAGLAGVVAVVAGLRGPADLAVCDGPDPVARWGERSEAVELRLASELARDGSGLAPRLALRLDRFVQGWHDARFSVCGAEGRAVPELRRHSRAACLVRGGVVFDAILSGLQRTPEADSLQRRLFSLDIPNRCLGDAPENIFARPEAEALELDELARRATEVLDAPLSRAAEVDALVDERLARAKELGDAWTIVRLLGAKARATMRSGDASLSTGLYSEAVWVAESAEDPLLAAEQVPPALGQLYDVAGPVADAMRLADHGDELVARAGDPIPPRVGILAWRGLHAVRANDPDAGIRWGAEALALAGDPPIDGTERFVGTAHLAIALGHTYREEWPAARRMAEALLELDLPAGSSRAALRGPAHAIIGSIAREQGDLETAIVQSLAQLYEIQTITDPGHPAVVVGVSLYATLLLETGATEEGLAHLWAARARLLDEAAGATLQLALVEERLMHGLLVHGQAERAHDLARQTLARVIDEQGETSAPAAYARLDLVETSRAVGDTAGAAAQLELALRDLGGDDAGFDVDAIALRGKLHLDAGRFAEARDDFVTALGFLGPDRGTVHSHGMRGDTLLHLAWALRGLGDREQARAVAAMADEALSHGAWVHQQQRREAAQLLDPHGDPLGGSLAK